MDHEQLIKLYHENMCENCGRPLPGGGLCRVCEEKKTEDSPEYRIRVLETKLAEAEACITIKNLDLRHVIYERDRLRKALELIASNARPIGTHWDDWAPVIAREALAPAPEEKK